jgi:hypothetical protein
MTGALHRGERMEGIKNWRRGGIERGRESMSSLRLQIRREGGAVKKTNTLRH